MIFLRILLSIILGVGLGLPIGMGILFFLFSSSHQGLATVMAIISPYLAFIFSLVQSVGFYFVIAHYQDSGSFQLAWQSWGFKLGFSWAVIALFLSSWGYYYWFYWSTPQQQKERFYAEDPLRSRLYKGVDLDLPESTIQASIISHSEKVVPYLMKAALHGKNLKNLENLLVYQKKYDPNPAKYASFLREVAVSGQIEILETTLKHIDVSHASRAIYWCTVNEPMPESLEVFLREGYAINDHYVKGSPKRLLDETVRTPILFFLIRPRPHLEQGDEFLAVLELLLKYDLNLCLTDSNNRSLPAFVQDSQLKEFLSKEPQYQVMSEALEKLLRLYDEQCN